MTKILTDADVAEVLELHINGGMSYRQLADAFLVSKSTIQDICTGKRWKRIPKPAKLPAAFKPHWPEGLKQSTRYAVQCDDDGRLCDATLSVVIAEDGDAHVSMHAYHDKERTAENLNPFPSIRIRTYAGGGRHRRTRQALLWLAEAIRLDNEELGIGDEA